MAPSGALASEDAAAYAALLKRIEELGPCGVAFSGGVDSSLLLYAAHEALGDAAFAITVDSPFLPAREVEEARAFCTEHGIQQVIVPVSQLEDETIAANPPDRCYLCKHLLFSAMLDAAHEKGVEMLLEGSNLDDEPSLRPGMRAIAEFGIESPLRDVRLSKEQIRSISKGLGLATWNKPSFSCLATRFPFGDSIDEERMERVDVAEQYLRSLGFSQVRARLVGDGVRIEVAHDEVGHLMAPEMWREVEARLLALGFEHAEADLEGYA